MDIVSVSVKSKTLCNVFYVVFTVKEAAEFLRVTPETVRRLCRRGKIPFARIGSDYRFLKSDLEALFLKAEPI